MKDLVVVIAIVVAWYVLNRYVLPRFGVKNLSASRREGFLQRQIDAHFRVENRLREGSGS